MLEEGFLTFGPCVTVDELRRMRFEYEMVFEMFDAADKDRYGGGEVERVASLNAITDCPALLSLIGNPHVVAIAAAGLGTSDIEYTGSILRRTLFDSFIHAPGSRGFAWHSDSFLKGDKATAPDDRVAIWMYLDDVEMEDGATQMLPGSTEHVRANLRAGRQGQSGLEDAKAAADDEENGVFAVAAAGGGMAFKSFVLHRARPNRSGMPRRIITFDFRKRGSEFVADGNFQELSNDAKQQVRDALPQSAHYLL